MAKLKDLVVAIGANTTDFDKKLGKSMHKLKAFGKNTKRLGQDMTRNVSLPIFAVAGGAVKAAADLETLQTSFISLAGGAEQAGKLMSQLNDFTAKTPFQIEQVGNAARQLIAAGTPIEDVNQRLQFLGDIAATSGSSIEEIASIFSKVQAKGKVELESLNQLAERGIPIFTALSEATGLPADALGAGAVSVEQFNEVLSSFAKEGGFAAGAMERLSQTAAGKLSTALDNLKLAGADLVKSLMPVLKDIIDGVTSMAQRFAALDDRTKKMILTFGLVIASIGPVIALSANLVQAFYAIRTAAKALSGSFLANPYVLAGAAIAALGVAAYKAQQPVTDLQDKVKSFSDELPGAPTRNWEDYMDSIDRGTVSLGEAATGFEKLRKEIEDTAKTAAENQGWVNSFRAGSPVLAEIIDLFTNYDEQLKDAAKAAADLDKAEKQAINNKEWLAIATERLTELGGGRVNVETAVADAVERQRVNMERMVTAQEKAKQAAEKLAKAFQDAGVAEAIQPMRGGQGERGLMTAGGRANTNLGLPSLDSIDRTADEVENRMEEMNMKMSSIANAISGSLTNAFSSLFRGLMDGTQSFGEFMKQVLTDLLIKLASMAAAFLLISALLPGSTIAQGGFGAFLQGGFGLTGFADGGIVSGPTAALVGEYAGARTNPEVIAPLDKLQSMIQGAGGGNVTVTGRISGKDIVLSNQRGSRDRSRIR